MKRTKPTKRELCKELGIVYKNTNPYDCSQLGMGANQPCPRCGLAIDKRSSNYEPIGFVKYCRC